MIQRFDHVTVVVRDLERARSSSASSASWRTRRW